MSRKSELILLIGNIGSGKSTLTREYAREGHIIINKDSLRYMIGAGDYIYNKQYEKAIKHSTLLILEQFMKLNVNIILDETNLIISKRKIYIDCANQFRYKKIAIILPKLSLETTIERKEKINHGNQDMDTWINLYNTFNNLYEKPSKREGFDKIIQL